MEEAAEAAGEAALLAAEAAGLAAPEAAALLAGEADIALAASLAAAEAAALASEAAEAAMPASEAAGEAAMPLSLAAEAAGGGVWASEALEAALSPLLPQAARARPRAAASRILLMDIGISSSEVSWKFCFLYVYLYIESMVRAQGTSGHHRISLGNVKFKPLPMTHEPEEAAVIPMTDASAVMPRVDRAQRHLTLVVDESFDVQMPALRPL